MALLELADNEYTTGIFLDLSKPFDHAILDSKINRYGFHGNVYKWLSNYVPQRK